MAIITEQFNVNGHDFIRTYSDAGKYVVRDGISYTEACDPAELGRTYTEGDTIPTDESEVEEILNILIGGAS